MELEKLLFRAIRASSLTMERLLHSEEIMEEAEINYSDLKALAEEMVNNQHIIREFVDAVRSILTDKKK
jgi:hypothetical protein